MLPAARVDWLLAPPHRSAIRRPGRAAWLHADPGAWIRAAALLRDAAEVMAQDPDVFQVAEARRSLRASVLEACDELLAGPYGGREPRELPIASPSLRRTSACRRRLPPCQPCMCGRSGPAVRGYKRPGGTAALGVPGHSGDQRDALLTGPSPHSGPRRPALPRLLLGFGGRRGVGARLLEWATVSARLSGDVRRGPAQALTTSPGSGMQAGRHVGPCGP